MSNDRVSWMSLALGLLLLGLASQASASMNVELLRANFNDKPLNMQIGTGGASVGEPIYVGPGLSAQVVAGPFATRSLRLGTVGSTGLRYMQFRLIDDEEIHSGELRTSFTIRTPPQPDDFHVRLRENAGSFGNHGGITFKPDGTIVTDDNQTELVLRNYAPNEDLHIEFVHQVAAGTYDMFINGVRELHVRAHASPQLEKGIASLLAGFPEQGGAQQWGLDDVHMVRTPGLLNADFNDKPLGMQIGTGGPTVGEPVSIFQGLIAVVEAGHFTSPALNLEDATMNSSRAVAFEFLDAREVTKGDLRISYRLIAAPVPDFFALYFRENSGGSLAFGSLTFATDGFIRVSDGNGGAVIGSFVPNARLLIEFRYDLSAGTYDIYINRSLVLNDRAHGVTAPGRGIGRVTASTVLTTISNWVIDDLYVYQPGVIFQNEFD